MNVILAYEKLNAFKDKISLWEDNIRHENVSRFSSLDETMKESKLFNKIVKLAVLTHLSSLSISFENFLPGGNLKTCDFWIRDPFLFKLNHLTDDTLMED
ncbi:hypothetical protein A3Q56_00644 [Intoshia linei]|uniref:Uncharacterized protein n=1 Tax=Intoshia linei TaxID=1819745 RepID=A0A177BDG6_9BILA|nr:hypothetical protein A3Q56_00644 [Intoshia linei]